MNLLLILDIYNQINKIVKQFYIIYPKSLAHPVDSIISNKKKLKTLKTLNLSSAVKPSKKIKKSKNCDLSQKISEKEF